MFILVPLSGDVIETHEGVKRTVSSYAPHTDIPAVYADADQQIARIDFADISKINGISVELLPSKVFTSAVRVKRATQLPQPFDRVVVDAFDEPIKVKSLKLRSSKLSDGLMVTGVDIDTKQSRTVRLASIVRIIRPGGEEVSARDLQKTYADYMGT